MNERILSIMRAIKRGIDLAREGGIDCSYPYAITVDGITYRWRIQ